MVAESIGGGVVSLWVIRASQPMDPVSSPGVLYWVPAPVFRGALPPSDHRSTNEFSNIIFCLFPKPLFDSRLHVSLC